MTAQEGRSRLCVYNGGFLTQGRLRRILDLAGWDVSVGVPGEDDWVGLWGRTRTAWRGEAVADWREAPVLTVEDAFLRSVHPGRVRGEPPIGLCLDRTGVHFDGSAPSDLEKLLATHPLDDTVLLNRAKGSIERLRHWHLGKYSATDPNLPVPDPAYVVVIDQTKGDAALCGAGRADFLEMLTFAAEENPGLPIFIKTHPETNAGEREGHFAAEDAEGRLDVALLTDPVSPWVLFEGAAAVYTHSSTLGFEAIFAGHKPRVFGQPFYAGWGLTQDQNPLMRRQRNLTRAQLFAAAMILYPVWYDPTRDTLCEVETVIDTLSAQARAWRDDRWGYRAFGMKSWKRPWLKRAFGRDVPMRFRGSAKGRVPMVWGRRDAPKDTIRVEDGFLRSQGLGAALTPPLSLVLDQPSLYFDPQVEGRLDRLIEASADLPHAEIQRAERLVAAIQRGNLTKYNIGAEMPEISAPGKKILVVGQVEDDASVLLGATNVRTNTELLQIARERNSDAVIMYKPHPDVEAGLRNGAVPHGNQADVTLTQVGAGQAISAADEVWTITSTLGFEALMRGKPVTCFGMPFYGGRGLTTDIAQRPPHRVASVTLPQLAHACLIGYPRYFDPRSGEPLSPEAAIWLLQNNEKLTPRVNKWLAWLQRFV